MNTVFRASFARDLKAIKDRRILDLVQRTIEHVEAATALQDINALKKLSGTDNCYRIRVGTYRIGMIIDGNDVQFARCLSRRDIYRFFP